MAIPGNILKSVCKIPALSESALRLLQKGGDKLELNEIVRIVKTDAVLIGRILQVVNSAALSLRTKISSLDRAIPYLGGELVTGIALAICAQQVFDRGLEGYEAPQGELWRHSLRCAIASRELARHSQGRVAPDVAYTAGLLHDIGKAVISTFLAGRSQELAKRLGEEQMPDFLRAETGEVGTNHAEVGRALAEHWRLPEELIAAVAFHHQPDQAPAQHQPLVYAVHLGDISAMQGGIGTGMDTLQYRLQPGYQQYLDIDEQIWERVMLNAEQEYVETLKVFGEEAKA